MNGHFCLVPRVSVHDRYYCRSGDSSVFSSRLVTVYFQFHVTYEIVFTLLWLLIQKNPGQSLVLTV